MEKPPKVTKFPETPDSRMNRILRERVAAAENSDGSENRPKDFETETGFTGTVFFYEDDLRNLHLNQNGLFSLFTIKDGNLRFMELRGPDGEHVTNQDIINNHLAKAEQLLADGKLEKIDQIKDQFELEL